jgi:hypothetical protein
MVLRDPSDARCPVCHAGPVWLGPRHWTLVLSALEDIAPPRPVEAKAIATIIRKQLDAQT